MSVMIQIRNVPEEVHRQIKARAALCGQSMSDYVLAELRKSLERPTREELLDRVARMTPTHLSTPAAEAIRRERESR